MIVKNENTAPLVSKICNIKESLDDIISEYLNEYADYGWDDTTETIANVMAQLELIMTRLEHATERDALDKYKFGIPHENNEQ